MGQLLLPIFPRDTKMVTPVLGVCEKDGLVHYLLSGLHHMVLLSCFMALCRIRNAEQLKKHSPGELGKLLGLDRVPEAGYFRAKLRQILAQSRGDELHRQLFRQWVGEMPELFFYIDGQVRVYHGGKANLPKRFVSREKLCLSGTMAN